MLYPYADYHMHTALCGHAAGSLDEYVQQAIAAGLKEIGFSDHAPMVHERLPGVPMDLRQLPFYPFRAGNPSRVSCPADFHLIRIRLSQKGFFERLLEPRSQKYTVENLPQPHKTVPLVDFLFKNGHDDFSQYWGQRPMFCRIIAARTVFHTRAGCGN